MPNVYRLKECPTCGAEHRRRGMHCSRSCGQKGKSKSEDHKRKIADSNREHMASDSETAEKSKWIITQQRRGQGKTGEQLEQEMDGWSIVPPHGLDRQYEKDSDGDIWFS